MRAPSKIQIQMNGQELEVFFVPEPYVKEIPRITNPKLDPSQPLLRSIIVAIILWAKMYFDISIGRLL